MLNKGMLRICRLLVAMFLLLAPLAVLAVGDDNVAVEKEMLAIKRFPAQRYSALSLEQKNSVLAFYMLANKEQRQDVGFRQAVRLSVNYYSSMNMIAKYSRRELSAEELAGNLQGLTMTELAENITDKAPESARKALPELAQAASWDSKAKEVYDLIDKAQKYFSTGKDKYDAKDYAGAVQDFTETLKVFSQDSLYCYWRGNAYYHLEQYKEAIGDYNKAIGAAEDDHYYYLRGKAYYKLEQYNEAIADYSQAITLKSDNGGHYFWRGMAHYKNYKAPQRLENALADFSMAINLEPNDAINYLWRGQAYNDLKQYNEAIADYTKAISLAPNDPYNYSARAGVYKEIKQKSLASADSFKAVEILTNEIKQNPQNGRLYESRGWSYNELFECGEGAVYQQKYVADYAMAKQLYIASHDDKGLKRVEDNKILNALAQAIFNYH